MSKSKKNKSTPKALFKVRVVYGFLHKLKIVVLGEVLEGKVVEGMKLKAVFSHGSTIGSWDIIEILDMDFINNQAHENFIGLMLKCKDEADFKLLQSLRVYDEVVEVE